MSALTFMSYATYATLNWWRTSWQREEASRIRSVQHASMADHVVSDPNVVLRASWAAIDDSTYQNALLGCPSMGPLRFGAAWDSMTGERLSTSEVLLAKTIWLWCGLLLAGLIGYEGRWLSTHGHRRLLTDRTMHGEAIASCARSAALSMVAAPLCGVALWFVFYDRNQSIRPALGTFWPSRAEEVIALICLATLGAFIAARRFLVDHHAYQAALGPHCAMCGYPLPPESTCPECGPSAGPAVVISLGDVQTSLPRWLRFALITILGVVLAAVVVGLTGAAGGVGRWLSLEPPLRF